MKYNFLFILIASFAVIAFVLALTPDYVLSNPGFGSLKENPDEPWHIYADEISYDKNLDQYIAKGKVVMTRTDQHLSADFARFDQQTGKVLAIGHVIMTVGEDVLVGNRLEMDVNTEIGTVYNGSLFMKAKHFYVPCTSPLYG